MYKMVANCELFFPNYDTLNEARVHCQVALQSSLQRIRLHLSQCEALMFMAMCLIKTVRNDSPVENVLVVGWPSRVNNRNLVRLRVHQPVKLSV
jgi:hypothetical protein